MQVRTIKTLDGSNTKLYVEPTTKLVIKNGDLEVIAAIGDCHTDKVEGTVAIRKGYGLVIVAVTGGDMCRVHIPCIDFKYATVNMNNGVVFQSDQREPWVVLQVGSVDFYLVWSTDHDVSVESIGGKTAQLILGSHRSMG